MLCKRCVIMQCLSVCRSVRFVNSIKMINHIFKTFSSSGSQTTLAFLYQTAWRYSDGDPKRGVKWRWGKHKLRFLVNSWLSIDWAALFYSSVDFTNASYWCVHWCIELSTDERNKRTLWWMIQREICFNVSGMSFCWQFSWLILISNNVILSLLKI